MGKTPEFLYVSEVFGPTFQGEGPATGQRAAFVRLGGCNLHCRWCDTPYTWDASRYDLRKELTPQPVPDIVDRVQAMDVPLVILTGGEPLLHQERPGWKQLLTGLNAFAHIHVETNGTIPPGDVSERYVDHYVVSPKLGHAGDPREARIKRPVLAAYAGLARRGRASLKVVCQSAADVRETARLAASVEWPATRAYVMPEGITADQVTARATELADTVLMEGLNMTSRLHVQLWGSDRAR